jgi:carbon monoxide dehydrogenase subunit G
VVHVTRTFTVERPPEVVVPYLADFGNSREWDPGTESCTRIDDGPVQVGATWQNVQKVLGMTSELTYRLDRLDPDRVVLVGHNDSVDSTDDITVRPHPEGSEVVYDATITFHGIAKLGSPVMQLEFEHLGNKTVTGIQQAVASLPASP